jgi:hypothetical protein
MVSNRFPTNEMMGPISQGPVNRPPRQMGFQNGGVGKEVVATRGVKLKNKAAEQKEKEKTEREEYMRKFDERAEKTVKHHTEQGNRAIDTISRFLKMTEDKTLARNRGGIANDVEREIRQELIQLALDMNNDENEEDNGKGSVVVLSVVTKIIMMYRDRLNQLEYEIHQLKNALQKKEPSSQATQQASDAGQ